MANNRTKLTSLAHKNMLFQEPSETMKLLHFVQEANYSEAHKKIKFNPQLMFNYVTYKNSNGTTESITPLKQAFKSLDTFMWLMFYEKVVNNEQYLAAFTQQLSEQKTHISIQALLDEYRIYNDDYNNWLQRKLSDKEIDAAWLMVGKKQRELFSESSHFLKEFCRKTDTWNINFTPMDTHPNTSEVHHYETGEDESVCPFVPNVGLGFDYGIVRGDGGRAARRASMGVGSDAKFDSLMLEHLYEQKMDDISKLRAQLEPSQDNTNKVEIS